MVSNEPNRGEKEELVRLVGSNGTGARGEMCDGRKKLKGNASKVEPIL